jgi:NadR type nicotinamide-nucleotide adenylyltransferase
MEKADEILLRIAIVGPESTGKTTLAEGLARYYDTLFVPEYARDYIGKLNRPYTIEDIVEISKGQIALEDKIAKSARRFLICDTNLMVTKIWAENAYKYCPEWIAETLKTRTYHLYLLTDIDTPWVADVQREHPHLREHLLKKYEEELARRTIPYKLVSGLGNQRLENAIRIIKNQFKTS